MFSNRIMEVLSIDVPDYLPFFLHPDINPVSADPMVISSGISLAGRWDIFATVTLMLILNILAEELYFRAWLMPKMGKLGPAAWFANGALFALYHTFQLWLFPVLLIASISFAFLVYRTRSVIPSLLAHVLINGLNVLFLFPMFLG